MKASRFGEEQIIGILREQEAGSATAGHAGSPGTAHDFAGRPRWAMTMSEPPTGHDPKARESQSTASGASQT
jgi:hypothetical protein